MSIEENLSSIAKSLQEIVEQGRLSLALKAAQNSEVKTSPSTAPSSGASEPGQTAPAPPPAATPEPPKRKGRPPKNPPASSPPVEPAAVATPAVEAPTPVVVEAVIISGGPIGEEQVTQPPEVTVEQRPEPDPVDDFLDEPKAETAYPDPTPENVRAAYIAYAQRNGGSTPHAGGRQKARDLLLKTTGFQIMVDLENHVKTTGDTSLYAKAIKAAVDG